ncbi:MAG: DUF6531 domain-containing protein, partial [Thermaerobacter sp.]|nr:DUF6531 domain-containing protein [Thermaerobacter sp.]
MQRRRLAYLAMTVFWLLAGNVPLGLPFARAAFLMPNPLPPRTPSITVAPAAVVQSAQPVTMAVYGSTSTRFQTGQVALAVYNAAGQDVTGQTVVPGSLAVISNGVSSRAEVDFQLSGGVAPGAYTVQLTTPVYIFLAGITSANLYGGFQVYPAGTAPPAPAIHVLPSTIPTDYPYGFAVTVVGAGTSFGSGASLRVFFQGRNVTSTAVLPTPAPFPLPQEELTFRLAPNLAAGTYTVQVSDPTDGTMRSALVLISAVSIAANPATVEEVYNQASTVQILGTNTHFGALTTVQVPSGGQNVAQNVYVASPTLLSLQLIPNLASGTYQVQVYDPTDGQLTADLQVVRGFAAPSVTLEPSPVQEAYGRASTVTVLGTDTSFGAGAQVSILANGQQVALNVYAQSTTRITFELAPDVPSGTYQVAISDPTDGVMRASLPVQLAPAPASIGFSPAVVYEVYGQPSAVEVLGTGTHFGPGTTLDVSDNGQNVAQSVYVASPTQINFQLPADLPSGYYPVTVTDPTDGSLGGLLEVVYGGTQVYMSPQLVPTDYTPGMVITAIGGNTNFAAGTTQVQLWENGQNITGTGIVADSVYVQSTTGLTFELAGGLGAGSYEVQIADPTDGTLTAPMDIVAPLTGSLSSYAPGGTLTLGPDGASPAGTVNLGPGGYLVENLTVPAGETLNILPGTKVFFTTNGSLTVDGTLNVGGPEQGGNEAVYLTSNYDTNLVQGMYDIIPNIAYMPWTAHKYWQGVQVNPGATVDANNVVLGFGGQANAATSVSFPGEVNVLGGTVNLVNTWVTASYTPVEVYGGQVVLQSSQLGSLNWLGGMTVYGGQVALADSAVEYSGSVLLGNCNNTGCYPTPPNPVPPGPLPTSPKPVPPAPFSALDPSGPAAVHLAAAAVGRDAPVPMADGNVQVVLPRLGAVSVVQPGGLPRPAATVSAKVYALPAQSGPPWQPPAPPPGTTPSNPWNSNDVAYWPAVWIGGGNLSVNRSDIVGNSGVGIYVAGGSLSDVTQDNIAYNFSPFPNEQVVQNGNQYGYSGIYNATGTPVSAPGNYWGSASGPFGALPISGHGDGVNAPAVNAYPWVGSSLWEAYNFGTPWMGALATGDYSLSSQDLKIPGLGPHLSITRRYNSQNDAGSVLSPSPAEAFGPGWSFGLGVHLSATVGFDPNTGQAVREVVVTFPNGREVPYYYNGNGQFLPVSDLWDYDPLTLSSGGFTLVRRQAHLVYSFNTTGQLVAVTDQNGNKLRLSYNAAGQLASATDAAGRSLTFTHDAAGQIIRIAGPLGRQYNYAYNPQGLLARYTDPAGDTTYYGYDAQGLLTSVSNPDGDQTS